ncbi:MAG TPA: hypothetical protein V6D00_09970 [Pantanalinema sp.]
MKTKWLNRALTLGLSVGILTAPTLAQAAQQKVVNGPTTFERGVQNGQSGTFVKYIEYTYESLADRLAVLGAGSGLSAADFDAIAAGFGTTANVSDAELLAKINQVKASRDVNAVTAAWYSQYASQIRGVSTYSQAGAVALALAKALVATGQFGAPMINVNDGAAYQAWGAAQRGWPLQAAAIHGPEYVGNTGNISQAALLKAWDTVMSYTGTSLGDPLVLDLNGNGKIEVTGKSAAKFRAKTNMAFVPQGAVKFDLYGTGKPVLSEWVKGGDGILVDNRKGKALGLVNKGKPLTIANLFGDDGGHFSGFMKLAREFDPNAKLASATGGISANLGILKGKTLDDMLVWIDNGDGKATAKELHKLSALGITEIRLPARFVQNEAGEYLERATFTRKGQEFGIQEVWFATEKNK